MTRAVVFAYHNVGVECLKVLLKHEIDVALVLTHTDNPAELIWFDSVSELCRKHGVEAITPDDVRGLAGAVLGHRLVLRPEFEIEGLSVDEVHRMMQQLRGQADIPWQRAEALHRQTEGNPLFVQEVLRYLVEEGLVVREDGRYVNTLGDAQAGIPEGLREVVGKMRMDSALSEDRDQIAPRVRHIMQTILDNYKIGIEVVGINLQQGGVRPPEQVQAAFDDVLKAGQERERAKNEAEAYANDVVPRAVGSASRLKQEAEAYKSRIVAQAQGDAQRFRSLYGEYQKAPQVTRDRLYINAMKEMYSNVSKVLVESRQGSNLLYLPLDKIMQMNGVSAADLPAVAPTPSSAEPASNNGLSSSQSTIESSSRGRDNRQRDRDLR